MKWLRFSDARLVPSLWRTIALGHMRGGEGALAALRSAGMHIARDAEALVGSPGFPFAEKKRSFDLAIVSVAELGFPEGARYDALLPKARDVRLGLCPPEVGPALRLAYRDQPAGERLVVAMRTLGDPDNPLLFTLDHDDEGSWLDVHDGHPELLWRPEDRFVFAWRKRRRWF